MEKVTIALVMLTLSSLSSTCAARRRTSQSMYWSSQNARAWHIG